MTPVEDLLSRLERVLKAGQGWSAQCPAHDDRRNSLSISVGDDGRALVNCHAGCKTTDVCAAVGLTLADLMPDPPAARNGKSHGRSRRPGLHATARTTASKAFTTAEDALAALERRHGPSSAHWTYHDAEGEPVGLVARWNLEAAGPGKPSKEIRPIARHADGWWIGAMPEPRPMYRLPELAAARRVVICEGEKAAETARSIGFVATTWAGGANAAGKTDWTPLAGKKAVYLMPDNDAPGRKADETIARTLIALNPPPAVVKIIELPGLPEHGDIVDWIHAHGQAAEPEDLRRQVEALLDVAKPFTGQGKPASVCLADLSAKPLSWLWQDYIPLGMLTLMDGDPGLGKSFLTIDLAARISRGLAMPPDGSAVVSEPAGVLMLNAEDDPARTIRPRMEAAGADVNRIHLPKLQEDDGQDRPVILPDDLPELERIIVTQKVRLVVIDPLMAFLTGKADSHNDADVRRILLRVKDVAERTQSAFVIVRHLNKLVNVAEPMYRGGGSIGIIGAARSAFLIAKHPEDDKQRVLARIKGNLCAEPPALAFTIDRGQVAWAGEVSFQAGDLLQTKTGRGRPAEALTVAMKFLTEALAKGRRLAPDVEAEAEKRGIKPATLKRARRELRVRAIRPLVIGSPWTWELAQPAAPAPVPTNYDPHAKNAENAGLCRENHNSDPHEKPAEINLIPREEQNPPSARPEGNAA